MSKKRSADLYLAYKITNTVNGRAYIGITSTSLRMRWGRHRRSALNEKTNTALARAIRKYGAHVFTIEHIATAYSYREACELECALISEHGTLHSAGGYNLTIGGDGFGYKLTDERRAEIALQTKQRWKSGAMTISPERRAEMVREAHRRDPTYAKRIAESKRGKRLDPKHREALSAAHKKPWLDPAYRERMLPIVKANIARPKSPRRTKQSASEKLARVIAIRLTKRAEIEAAEGVKIEGDPLTHCARGHLLLPERKSHDGRVRCRTCTNMRQRLRWKTKAGDHHEQRQQSEP